MEEMIPIGSDHAGYELKEDLVEYLKELGYQPEDMGTRGPESVDYPDFAAAVAQTISRGERRRGILVCGTGIGMSISANRFPGVRAALAWQSLQRMGSHGNLRTGKRLRSGRLLPAASIGVRKQGKSGTNVQPVNLRPKRRLCRFRRRQGNGNAAGLGGGSRRSGIHARTWLISAT